MVLEPPITRPHDLDSALRASGYGVLDGKGVASLAGVPLREFDRWRRYWDDLPLDGYLRDGGRYRRRRHASFIVTSEDVERVAERPHWQPVDYNALHGGLERWFEPMPRAWTDDAAWKRVLQAFAVRADRLRGTQRWYVEAHPFRIDTAGGIGRPTPEGAHRDGVDLVVVLLVARERVIGGETRVFAANAREGLRFTLQSAWTALVLDDARVIHETTPIQPADEAGGHRDTLVLTYRAGGFQSPESPPR